MAVRGDAQDDNANAAAPPARSRFIYVAGLVALVADGAGGAGPR